MKKHSLLRSFGFAFSGILLFFRKERNARIHLAAAAAAIMLGFYFKIRGWEWVAVIVSILCVWIAEMLNTAIETLSDHLHPGKSEQIRIVKDISAGAVVLAAMASLIIGSIVFIPKILS